MSQRGTYVYAPKSSNDSIRILFGQAYSATVKLAASDPPSRPSSAPLQPAQLPFTELCGHSSPLSTAENIVREVELSSRCPTDDGDSLTSTPPAVAVAATQTLLTTASPTSQSSSLVLSSASYPEPNLPSVRPDSTVFVKLMNRYHALNRAAYNPKIFKLCLVNENPALEIEAHRAVTAAAAVAGRDVHVVKLLDVIDDDSQNTLALVLEHAAGGDLFSALEASHRSTVASADSSSPSSKPVCTGFPEALVQHIARQLVCALSFVHSCGFAHRDVSLENVLLRAAGSWDVMLADFGLATRVDATTKAVSRKLDVHPLIGKPFIAAPEAWQSCPLTFVTAYDGYAADVWSLGVLVAACLFGGFLWNEPRGHRAEDSAALRLLSQPRSAGSPAHPKFSETVPLWSFVPRVSPAALDWLDQALCWMPSDRATLAALAAHPWLASDNACVCSPL